eukprot:1831199-Heterocapsa_arctica.AAC.1
MSSLEAGHGWQDACEETPKGEGGWVREQCSNPKISLGSDLSQHGRRRKTCVQQRKRHTERSTGRLAGLVRLVGQPRGEGVTN